MCIGIIEAAKILQLNNNRRALKLFQEQKPSWDKVQTVMTNKDFVEREVFKKKELIQTKLKICLFYVLKTFWREMTTEKNGENKWKRDNILEILQKIAYSSTLEQYETNKPQQISADGNTKYSSNRIFLSVLGSHQESMGHQSS